MTDISYPPYSEEEKAQIQHDFGVRIAKFVLIKVGLFMGLYILGRKLNKLLEK